MLIASVPVVSFTFSDDDPCPAPDWAPICPSATHGIWALVARLILQLIAIGGGMSILPKSSCSSGPMLGYGKDGATYPAKNGIERLKS